MVQHLAAQVEQLRVRIWWPVGEQQAVAGVGSDCLEQLDGGLRVGQLPAGCAHRSGPPHDVGKDRHRQFFLRIEAELCSNRTLVAPEIVPIRIHKTLP